MCDDHDVLNHVLQLTKASLQNKKCGHVYLAASINDCNFKLQITPTFSAKGAVVLGMLWS